MDKSHLFKRVTIQEYTSRVRAKDISRRRAKKLAHDQTKLRRMQCTFCHAFSEGYMLEDKVWEEAGLAKNEMVCPHCVEIQLGRPLQITDFTNACINTMVRIGYLMGFQDGRDTGKAETTS